MKKEKNNSYFKYKELKKEYKRLEKEFKRYELEKESELDNLYIELNWYQEHYG